jgi:hypothetical protein
MKNIFVLVFFVFFGLFLISASVPADSQVRRMQDIKPPGLNVKPQALHQNPKAAVKPDVNFGKIPLYFIFNKGQVNEKALFYAKASRYTLWLTGEGLVFDSVRKVKVKAEVEETHPVPSFGHVHPSQEGNEKFKIERDVSRLVFLNANKNPEIIPLDESTLRVNYFIGNDPSKWHCDVPTSKAVLYKNLYKNIDLKVYGIEKQIEYDWIVKPGGNPEDIRVEYKNVKNTRIDDEGNLLIETDFGELMHKKPVSYQQICMEHGARSTGHNPGGTVQCASHSVHGAGVGAGLRACPNERKDVNVTFKKMGKNIYGFAVGEYDKRVELIIDPVVLAYSTYLGGENQDNGCSIAVDSSGNAYVTGSTESTTYPTLNPYQANQGGTDAFITKIDTTQSGASSLIYSTYLGGGGSDLGASIAVDGSGNAYVTGDTDSADFPCLNQYQTYQGGSDAFVTKIDTNQSGASSLIYSTYLGGGSSDFGTGIAVDSSGNAYVTGWTDGTDFPCKNQYQTVQGLHDAFVTRIDTTQSGVSSLIYSTYLGGISFDYGSGIAVDSSGNAYVIGRTNGPDFPCQNQYQTDQGSSDAFVTKIDTNQSGVSSLIYSSYLGGGDFDHGWGIAVDNSGNAYVTGRTDSTDFPCKNQYQNDPGDSTWDGFVTRIDTTQSGVSSLIYSTYLGGGSYDKSVAIAVDNSGYAYVAGWTESTDFPCKNQYQTDQGTWDVFVTKIDTNQSGASSLFYSTYLGGGIWDYGEGLAVDSSGNVYVTGRTFSPDFPTLNQYQADQGSWDTFITKLIYTIGPLPTVTTTAVTSITATTASGGGNVISDGGAAVTARGVCWSTSPNPTIADSYTTNGTGTGVFTSSITGLTPGTTYYVRAYATNSIGTAYGNPITFTTSVLNNPTISGTVSDGTAPIQGVTITFSHDGHTETTNANGYYSYTVPYGATTTVTPAKPGYGSWNPASKTFTNITSDETQNFVGSMANCTISGTVTDGTNPVKNVTVTFSHDGHTETTDADGYYAYTMAYGTSTVVTASKPGYTFTPPQYSYTNLTADQPHQDFTVLYSIFVTITNPHDGDTVSRSVMITAEVSSTGTGSVTALSSQSVTKVEFYIDGVLVKQDQRAPYKHLWNTTPVPDGSHTIKAKAYHTSGLTHQHRITVNVYNSTAPPYIWLNRTWLNFGAVIGDSHTGSQRFLIGNSGGGALDWTASLSDNWMQASPLSGTADTMVIVSVDDTGLSPGSYTGVITITDPKAGNSPESVFIYLEVKEKPKEEPLFGSFETPVQGSTVSGSIPVTGWAIDDVEVSHVKIFRNPLPGHETGLIYIGAAVFVEGARPDVEGKYATYPKHYQAGWGYMMLTNLLPDEGNGTFVITAVAADSSGNEVTLGTKTIICDNANAVKPFGAIDTPTQGGDAFGIDFVNFGWALTPRSNTIPINGTTIKVCVDGVPLEGNPVYNQYREDVAGLFPGYNNSEGAVGYYYLDTTLYANGVHTIAWSVTDDAGNTDGIGSRYFNIMNVSNPSTYSAATGQYAYKYHDYLSIQHLPAAAAPVYLKKGYHASNYRHPCKPGSDGVIAIEIKENQPIAIQLGDQYTSPGHYSGYMLIGNQLKCLPVGSFLDTGGDVFYWQPGPGFVGEYSLVFIGKNRDGEFIKKHIKVMIHPGNN